MQETHTAHGVDLAAVALGCGFANASVVREQKDLEPARAKLLATDGPVLVQFKVVAEKLPLVLPPHDGVVLRDRFRRVLLGAQ
jgi:thiamine pyrophosphate-dependent acetolactate synthase large subunit-like protein